jgi:hypothetical protein
MMKSHGLGSTNDSASDDAAVQESPVSMGKRSKFYMALALGGLAATVVGFLVAQQRDESAKHETELRKWCAAQRPRALKGALPKVLTSAQSDFQVPGQPGYDSALLSRVMHIADIFEQEPRDPSWAGAVEKGIENILALPRPPELLPGLEITAIECKTTLCKVSWNAPAQTAERARRVLPILLPGATMNVSPRHGRYLLGLSGGTDDWKRVPNGDPTGSLNTAIQLRRMLLADIQSGRGGALARDVPVNEWPKE